MPGVPGAHVPQTDSASLCCTPHQPLQPSPACPQGACERGSPASVGGAGLSTQQGPLLLCRPASRAPLHPGTKCLQHLSELSSPDVPSAGQGGWAVPTLLCVAALFRAGEHESRCVWAAGLLSAPHPNQPSSAGCRRLVPSLRSADAGISGLSDCWAGGFGDVARLCLLISLLSC